MGELCDFPLFKKVSLNREIVIIMNVRLDNLDLDWFLLLSDR